MTRRFLTVLTVMLLACAACAATASAATRHHPSVHTRRALACVTARRARAPRRGRPTRSSQARRRAGRRCAHVTRGRPLAGTAAVHHSPKPVRRTQSVSSVPSVSGGLIVGLNANVSGWGNASTQPRMDQVSSDTHTKWLREQFRWDQIEPAPGQFDFSYYDHFMLIAAQAGEHVLPLLYSTPAWAGANDNAIPSDPAAFAQFVAAVVGRYGANGSFWNQYPTLRGSAIHTWEIWNEPYYASGDNGDYSPGNYARLVKAAAIAGRGADANAKFLLASEMYNARDTNGDWQWWTDALYQAVPDLNHYFDGVAVHPYGTNTTTLNPMIAGQPYNNYDNMRRIENIHQQFLAHGATDKPFWITEIGWSTCTTDSGCVTPAQQAADITTLFADLHGSWSTWVQAAFLYHYTDGANPTGNIQDAYGLTTNTGTPKPALAILQAQANLSSN